ncbi:MAG: acetyl-CoA carboxylase biotin carboxyl carrier protein [Ruminococcus sp.]|nr:acetyl-CoA carboxylase biotin carboxyl carrier protein [Ruminococcus sp.]MDE6784959.1 acetyl-CoA carboxylase biotin carboxyl carrier protein [Ruminococcus sp.]
MNKKIFDIVETETIEKIAEIVSKNELSEITVKISDCVVTVKGKKPQPVPPVMPVPMGIPAQAVSAPVQTDAAAPVQQEIKGNVVKSPIVGTFYQAPSPDKPPFVKVGDTVKKGDVIMIIESMKLMNEVQSEFDGTVEKILVTDGQPVEFDQPIMIIS